MRFNLDGVEIAYSDEGRGMPVVLLHAFANDSELWRPQVDALRERYRMIVPDLRGFGGSGDTDGRTVSMDEYADDIARLLDHLNLQTAVIGGISLGGYVALSLVIRHPKRLAGLVLANTRAQADNPDWAAFREEMVSTIEDRGPEAVVENYGEKPFGENCPDNVKAAVRAMIRRQRRPALISATRGMALRPDRMADLAHIRVPTLIIHGSDDQYIPTVDAGAMSRAIVGSVYVVISGAGHLSNIDSPTQFNVALNDFLMPLARSYPQ